MSDERVYTDDEERRLRCEKLQLEQMKLQQELSPGYQRLERMKTIAATSGIVTAFIAVAGIAITIVQWRSNLSQSEESRISERVTASLTLLAAEREPQRLAGVASLSSFLQDAGAARKLQVLRAYANALAVEPSELIRNGIISAIGGTDGTTLNEAEQQAAIRSFVDVNRITFESSRSRENTPTQQAEARMRARSLGEAVAILFKRGFSTADLSRTYLADVDFSGISFPERTSFRGANLRGTRFDGARVQHASFQSTSLPLTSFVGAHLEGTDFSWPDEDEYDYGARTSGLIRHGGMLGSVLFSPKFDCADLTSTNFRGFPLFAVFNNKGVPITGVPSVRFANLTRADLREAVVIGSLSSLDEPNHNVPTMTIRSRITPLYRIIHWTAPENNNTILLDVGRFMRSGQHGFAVNPVASELNQYSFSLQEMARSFGGAKWKGATLSPAVRVFFASFSPDNESLAPGTGCKGVSILK